MLACIVRDALSMTYTQECVLHLGTADCGQGRLGRLLCPYLYGNVTLIDFCVGRHTSRPRWSDGFHCQMLCEDPCVWEASSFEEGSSKGTPSTGLVHAGASACMYLRERPHSIGPSGLWAEWKRLGTWVSRLGLGFEDYLSFVSVLICYLGRLRLALFLAWLLHIWIELNTSDLVIFRDSYCCWKASKNSLACCIRPQIWSHASETMCLLCSKGWLQDRQHQSWRLVVRVFTQVGCQHRHSQHFIKMDTGQAGLVLIWVFLCESPHAGWLGPWPKQLHWVPL